MRPVKLLIAALALALGLLFAEAAADSYKIDAVFLPVNGAGNNMNMADAARFAIECGARWAVPVHFGMFDALDPREMACPNKVIPTVYREIVLPGK